MSKEFISESDSITFTGIETKGSAIYSWFEIRPEHLNEHKIVNPDGELFAGYKVPSLRLEDRRRKLVAAGIEPNETTKAIAATNLERNRRRAARQTSAPEFNTGAGAQAQAEFSAPTPE